jgi:MFS superfamily sulfate permease-like transporter
LHGWFLKSFRKTQNKVEWLVNPFIVLTASFVGLLSAVFLGIALSTFFFVAAFYRSGVVKYVATGITIRSTIERPTSTARWLDTNGDLIQILVLQSYLFFGNATSVLNYVKSMFEETEAEKERRDSFEVPPLPKVVVLDFSLVPGMDGSAVDVSPNTNTHLRVVCRLLTIRIFRNFLHANEQVMADLLSTCAEHNCKLFLSGTSVPLRKTLRLGGMQPDTSIKDRSQRKLRFFPDIDSAVGKAEDLIIQQVYEPSSDCLHGNQPTLEKRNGFARCLAQIDEQASCCNVCFLVNHIRLTTHTDGPVPPSFPAFYLI